MKHGRVIPVRFVVKPGVTEFAPPVRSFEQTRLVKEALEPPDRILHEELGLVLVETTVMPSTNRPGSLAQVHTVFRPNHKIKMRWNNEVKDMVFFIPPLEEQEVGYCHLTVERPAWAVSQEVRKEEFELKSSSDFAAPVTLPTYALYYVCINAKTCL